ncbi:uncharacterized protein LOC130275287 [Hyla sarda]|uniref:uncharacterized protein LOC130275287 n=1 Tax=Hyla sarda TaxID=327740 RepID=UPI0024C23B6E|nr:uncharacterized protein LOC130275287 [Hyla sarda]
MENSEKSKKMKTKLKKKESRHNKTSDNPKWETENVTLCGEEGQDSNIISDSSIKSRKRTPTESDENRPPRGEKAARNTREVPDPSGSPQKKTKKKKKKKPPSVQSVEGSDPLHRSAPETISRNVKTPNDPKYKTKSKSEDGTSQWRRQPLAFHRSNVLMMTSTPRSSPIAPPKTKRDNGQIEDMNGISDQSQDLFITQKKFVLSHCTCEDSPPLGQEQHNGVRDWLGNQQPHHGTHLLSQLSCLRHNSVGLSSIESNQQVTLKENSTQTEVSFTYLALMSLMKKAKVLEPCSEEALDLSLPSRIRAKKAALSPGNDVIIVESQSTSADFKDSRKNNIKFCFSPVQRADETKFVQTVLNTSYFFKGKGDPGEASPPIPPILKMKEKPKKKCRRSKVHVKKEAKAT